MSLPNGINDSIWRNNFLKRYKITVAGIGYVGMSVATLLAQKHDVCCVDIVPGKIAAVNARKSPIKDEYIEKYFAEKELNLNIGKEVYVGFKAMSVATLKL